MDFKEITSFELACKAKNIPVIIPDYSHLSENDRVGQVAGYMLLIIIDAVNGGNENLDFTQHAGKCDIFWDLNPSDGSGFVLHSVASARTAADVGARLTLASRERAEHLMKYFMPQLRDFFGPKKAA